MQKKEIFKDKTNKVIIILVLVLLTTSMIIFSIGKYTKAQMTSTTLKYEELVEQLELDNEELRETLKKLTDSSISLESIRENVKSISQMNVLEYNYTSFIFYSTDNKIFKKIKVPFTTNRFIATIDGKVVFGFNTDSIDVKELENGKIEILCPHAEITHNYTDQSTLKVLDEKKNVFNPVDAKDYNELIIDVESKEKDKAINNGLGKEADERMKSVVLSYLKAAYGTAVEFEFNFI